MNTEFSICTIIPNDKRFIKKQVVLDDMKTKAIYLWTVEDNKAHMFKWPMDWTIERLTIGSITVFIIY